MKDKKGLSKSQDNDDFKEIAHSAAWKTQKAMGKFTKEFPNRDQLHLENRPLYISKKSGNRYRGEWNVTTNRMHGFGIKVWKEDGRVYVGHFENSEPSDYGRLVGGRGPRDGNKYEGGFLNGRFHGEGKFSWNDGREYEGNWVKGQMSGKGKMKFSDEGVYEGDWKDGE